MRGGLCGQDRQSKRPFPSFMYQEHLVVDSPGGFYNITADSLSRIYSNSPVNESILKKLRDHYIWEHIPSTYQLLIPQSYFELPLLPQICS